MCDINFSFIKVVTLPLNNLFLFCWSTLGALAAESKDLFSTTTRMSLILFWAEVEEEEEDNDENSIFLGLMKTEEEEEESSLVSRLMKMESDEEE